MKPLTIRNCQRAIPLEIPRIRLWVQEALPGCREAIRREAPLARLDHVSVAILSDRAIARIHARFLEDATPTDVITFDHGEILIGAGVVSRQAADYGHSPTEETALCVIHGLLHLAGWRDDTPAAARAMAQRQDKIFRRARGY